MGGHAGRQPLRALGRRRVVGYELGDEFAIGEVGGGRTWLRRFTVEGSVFFTRTKDERDAANEAANIDPRPGRNVSLARDRAGSGGRVRRAGIPAASRAVARPRNAAAPRATSGTSGSTSRSRRCVPTEERRRNNYASIGDEGRLWLDRPGRPGRFLGRQRIQRQWHDLAQGARWRHGPGGRPAAATTRKSADRSCRLAPTRVHTGRRASSRYARGWA